MNSNTLLHPSQLTPELCEALLKRMQDACERFNAKTRPQRTLFIRDFWFLLEEGCPFLDLFVEPAPGHTGETPFPLPDTAVTLDECLALHQFLLEDDCLDPFDDAVGVRVGSLGIEPPLRTRQHFESAKGQLVTLKTWTKRQGRDRFTAYLIDVLGDITSPSLGLKDGAEVFEIPLSAVKFAQALLSKPKLGKTNTQKAFKEAKRGRRKA